MPGMSARRALAGSTSSIIFCPPNENLLRAILKMKGYGMSNIWMKRFFLLAFVGAACSATFAQQIVHAVTGAVTSVDPANNTITIETNDGSDGVFKYQKGGKTEIVFDKEVRNGTTEPASFNKIGDHVVAYYVDIGFGTRTVVALKDFGPSALKAAATSSPEHDAGRCCIVSCSISNYQLLLYATCALKGYAKLWLAPRLGRRRDSQQSLIQREVETN